MSMLYLLLGTLPIQIFEVEPGEQISLDLTEFDSTCNENELKRGVQGTREVFKRRVHESEGRGGIKSKGTFFPLYLL